LRSPFKIFLVVLFPLFVIAGCIVVGRTLPYERSGMLHQRWLGHGEESGAVGLSRYEDRGGYEGESDDNLRYPISSGQKETYEDIGDSGAVELATPSAVNSGVEYDPRTGLYFFRTRVGDEDIVTPFSMSESEYMNHAQRESMRAYYQDRIASETAEERNRKFSLSDIQFGIGKADKVFGPGGVQVKMQGSAELLFGAKINKVQNPALSERLRNPSPIFDFDEKIQLNVNGKVGDRVNFNMNYNTEATFDFDQSAIKLAYEGKEDDIVQRVEAGNVSMPLNSSLIRGSSALFGIRADLKFGNLSVQSVVSQQESESKTVSLKNGAQTMDFEVEALDYDENRHFFLSHYFRDNYEKNMSRLPNITSGVQINRVEVWITNKRADFTSARNLIAFLDLGESDSIHAKGTWSGTSGYPSNKVNNLYSSVIGMSDIRDVDKANTAMSSAYPSLIGGEDYEKLESARMLNSTEYTVNAQLGFISLKTRINDDEVLAVAYEYTAGGQTYQVGEFSTDGIDAPRTLVVKLLKGTSLSPSLPNWHLMMKNVYALGATQVQSDNFKLNITYQSDSSGVYINNLPEASLSNVPLLRLLGMDRLDRRARLRPDGNFDYVEGYTILPDQGRVIFPVLEPFGASLRKAIGNSAVADKYAYDELYTMTKSDAENYSAKAKFRIEGEYKASNANEIRLGAMNIPKGSVSVTAGGVRLSENVDYTVDYAMGTVTILNEGLLESGTNIDVSLENQSLFSMQRKTLIGTHLEYMFNPNLSVGGTVMHLSEKPLTTKVAMGDEPISNTIWGLNFAYKNESQRLTTWLDKLPLLNLKAPSSYMLSGEFAQLIPGHQSAIGSAGYSYIDDFESAATNINILYPYAWSLASTPQGRFPEGRLSNNVSYGKNRALLAWYSIDPIFTRSTSTTPSYLRKDSEQQSNHYVREVSEQEIYPNREPISGQTNTLTVLNMAYYPDERGPYNLDADNIEANGRLSNPEGRWGGIMRRLDVTDFESANIDYVQFWLMDPFIYNPNAEGGDLYIDLGEISEDVLKDGKKSYENGYNTTGTLSLLDTTVWGYAPRSQATVYAFDNTTSARRNQDVGLDGMRSEDEFSFSTYQDYVTQYRTKVGAQYLDSLQNDPFSPLNDPAGDDYHYYQGDDYDDARLSILDRYKRYNGMEGNSPVATSTNGQTTSATNMPNTEDVNLDFNMNEYEKYFEYRVSLRPEDLQVGKNNITDKITSTVELKNGNHAEVSWYQFKVPIKEYEDSLVFGSIRNFKSIRFVRMYMTHFKEETHLRFGDLSLIRGEWRRYQKDLYQPTLPPVTSQTGMDVSVVSIEENASKTPVNYILPPGVEREKDPSQTQIRQQNEQSMQLRLTQLSPGDARAVYKTVSYDMRPYKRMQMYIHAEKMIDDATNLKSSDITCFLRVGSDMENNYYEYEVPLKLTPAGMYSLSESSSDRGIVWPAENMIDIPFSLFTDVKKSRNRAKREGANGVSFMEEYSVYDPDHVHNRVTVKGNPTLGEVKRIMIGLRNRSGEIKSAEVWVNELRMKGFDEDGGWGAQANASVALSDFATVNLAGHMETAGFGSIEDNVQDRRMDDFTEFNVSTSAELGKLFPEKANVSIPVYYAYGREVSTPKYDPTNTDLLLKESLDELGNSRERDSLENLAKTVYTTRSFNITNARVNIKSEGFPMPYDPANFSVSYAYTESQEHSPDVLRGVTKDYKGTFTYQYALQPKPWEPFKKVKALKKPAFRLISDFNLYYLPTLISFNTSLMRQYEELQDRDLSGAGIDYNDPNNALLSVSKDFIWNRQFDLKYDLSRELKFSFSAATNSQIDETKYAPVNQELFPTEYDNWRDTVWRSLMSGGTPLSYQQSFNANFTMPFNKIPILNFLTGTASYTGNYTWDHGALTAEDEAAGRTNSSLGNDVTSIGTWQVNGRANLERLYNKSPYLKRANQRFALKNNSNKKKEKAKEQSNEPLEKTQKISLQKGKKKKFSHRLNTEKVKLAATDKDGNAVKLKYKVVDRNTVEINPDVDGPVTVTVTGKRPNETPTGAGAVLQGMARAAMFIRNVSFSYSQTDGMSMTGFIPESGFLGQDGGAPGVLFALGYQKAGFLRDAFDKGWMVTGDSTISPVSKTHTTDLTLRVSTELIPSVRVDFAASRSYAKSLTVQYQYDGMPTTFTGSFSQTTIGLKSFFASQGKSSNNYYNSTFEKFKSNRYKVRERLMGKYASFKYPSGGFMNNAESAVLVGEQFDPANGEVSLNSAEVLIPSFMNAYTGSSITDDELIPGLRKLLPNWRVSFDGLSRLPFIKDHFKSVNLTHVYSCKYNIGSFSSYSSFVGVEGDYGFISDVTTGLPMPSSCYDISSVSITENFNPLIRVDATLNNSLSLSTEYRTGRTETMNVSSAQVISSHNGTIAFGVGYKISDFDVILRLNNDKEQKVSNDLTLRFDVSKSNTSAIIRKLAEDEMAQATSGEESYSAQFTAEYVFSSRLNVKFYYDYQSSTPLISSSYPTSNHNFGFSLKLLLTR